MELPPNGSTLFKVILAHWHKLLLMFTALTLISLRKNEGHMCPTSEECGLP